MEIKYPNFDRCKNCTINACGARSWKFNKEITPDRFEEFCAKRKREENEHNKIQYNTKKINLQMRIDRGILFGEKAKYTYWGRKSCSHGIYSSGGYNFYVYGIKGILNIIIDKRWGDMAIGERRF